MSTYRLHDHAGDDLGLLEAPGPPGDVVTLPDRRESLVTAHVEAEPRPLVALLPTIALNERPRALSHAA